MTQVLDLTSYNADSDTTVESTKKLRAEFLRLGNGKYPVLKISEFDTSNSGRDEFHGLFDTARLIQFNEDGRTVNDRVDYYSLRYVEHILVSILSQAQRRKPEELVNTFYYETSYKYSFSDTPTWWKNYVITPDEVGDRTIWKIEGDIS